VILAPLLLVALSACGGGPTWHQDIAPIVDRSCSGCHTFDATTAPRQARQMAAAVMSGRMPPFLADTAVMPYSNDPRLSPAERALFAAWAADPEVGTPRRQETPSTGELYEGEPYAPGDVDEIRCFLLRPRPGFFSGYRWTGAGAHHFEATVIPAAGVGIAETRGGARGWDCRDAQYDIPTKTSLISTNPAVPYRYPAGYGVELAPGDALILYAHLTPQQDRSPRRFGIALEYGAPGKPVVQHGWNAPSEVPCPPALASQPQCQRAWARSRALLGLGLNTPEEQVSRCGAQTFKPSADGLSMTVRSRCEGDLPPGKWRLLGVRAHLHLRGLSASITGSRPLLRIPAWDYRYEDTYAPAELVEVSGKLTIDCSWVAGSRYHTFELGRDGEMCVGSVVLGSL
jgi:hypothetical protein